ncbi:MAG: alkaline metalloproteinase [Caulobacter sp.]|nr:alkaline metalloproteinase [Caulobacter sp.]
MAYRTEFASPLPSETLTGLDDFADDAAFAGAQDTVPGAFSPDDRPVSVADGGGDAGAGGFLNADQRGGTATNGKPSMTIDEAAVQLNRTYSSWNTFDHVNGVADVDNNWDDPVWGGGVTHVTFAFRSAAPTSMPDDTAGFSRFTTAQINATLLALASWSDVANVVFDRVGTGTSGEAAYSGNAKILYGNYASGADGAAAFAYFPSQSAIGGDVWVNSSLSYNANPALGNYGMLTLVHETGHAIGFSHPGAYNADANTTFTYASSAEYYEDSHQYTVMSYFTENNTGADFGPAYPATIMLDDIAAAQRTYGVNRTTRTGDTVYGFNSNADRPWFVAASAGAALVFAVWDAGGADTFDFSGYGDGQTIDLREGAFSSVGSYNGRALVGNVAIAKGAVIENAIGGAGADTLVGNAVANHLTGGGGNDSLTGGAGADVFQFAGAAGNDVITDFKVGTDRIDDTAYGQYKSIVQSGADALVTLATGVTVRLTGIAASTVTSASFLSNTSPPPPPPPPPSGGTWDRTLVGTIGANTLTGDARNELIQGLDGNDTLNGLAGADRLEGGAGADRLSGGDGDDVLVGGAGQDTLTGGAGADVFVLGAGDGANTIADFQDGIDHIDIGGYGAYTAISQLTSGAKITFGDGGYVILSGVQASSLSAADFVGAASPPPPPSGGGLTPPAGYVAVTGASTNDTKVGGTGSDAVQGLAGNDTLYGRDGDDWVSGGTGADKLFGEGGADVLYGGSGADLLWGGAGADAFVYGATADSTAGAFDTIRDFSAAAGDVVDLSDVDANIGLAGNQAFALVAAFTGAAGQMTVSTASGISTLSFDVNGDGVADMVIKTLGAVEDNYIL